MGTTALRDVELIRTGTWGASTGATTVTDDDFAAIVAAYSDSVVDRPIVKLGHQDDNAMNTALGDGAPAYGWIENVGVGNGTTARPNAGSLYGDLVGMPAKLAAIVPAAFRRRSVEIAWGVKTAAGKRYAAVLTGVALLGAAAPAVKGLADLMALYADGQVAETGSLTELEVVDDDDTAAVHPQPPAAREPEPDETGTGSTTTKETTVTLTKAAIDAALENVAEADLAAKMQELLASTEAPATGEGEQAAETTTQTAPVTTITPATEVVEVEAKTAATAAAPETVVVSASVFSELTKAAKTVETARRDGIVATAFSEGKITGPERKTWREALDRDEDGTVSLLSAMQPRFATSPVGDPTASALSAGDAAVEDAAYDDFMADLKTFG